MCEIQAGATLIQMHCSRFYSLYSTATRNPSRWGFALGNTPNASLLHCQYQHDGIVSKNPPGPNENPTWTQCEAPLTQCEPPQTQHEPNMSRWNIGRVGSPWVEARIGHVDLMLFVPISVVLGSQRERGFWWNMGTLMPF